MSDNHELPKEHIDMIKWLTNKHSNIEGIIVDRFGISTIVREEICNDESIIIDLISDELSPISLEGSDVPIFVMEALV